MFEVILACTKDYGIGLNFSLPWNIPEELKIFKEKTLNSVVVCGRNTAEYLPELQKRIIYKVSRKNGLIEKQIENIEVSFPDKKIFIAGGGQIYDYVFRKMCKKICKLHVSVIKGNYKCDSYITELNLREWVILEEKDYENFTHYVLKYDPRESQYTDLIKSIPDDFRLTRNGETASVFGRDFRFDLSDGLFPLLTTKKMFFRGIVEELLFFIRGDTDTKVLESKGINIWKGNTNREFLDSLGMKNRREGLMGPMYGYQWRFFNCKYDEEKGSALNEGGVDQLQNVINLIRKDPTSRRIVLTSFNPEQAGEGVLYPCHSLIIQFYVNNERLDMFCYNRSQDLFLGTPFNIASSALLLFLIAKITDKKPGVLNMGLGDVHLYKSHYELAKMQAERQPYMFPILKINRDIKELCDICEMTKEDFSLENYRCHPVIKAEMIA